MEFEKAHVRFLINKIFKILRRVLMVEKEENHFIYFFPDYFSKIFQINYAKVPKTLSFLQIKKDIHIFTHHRRASGFVMYIISH